MVLDGTAAPGHRRAAGGLPLPALEPGARPAVPLQPRRAVRRRTSATRASRGSSRVRRWSRPTPTSRGCIPTLPDRFRMPPGFSRRDVQRREARAADLRPLEVDVVGDIGPHAVGPARHGRASCCWSRAPTSPTCSWSGRRPAAGAGRARSRSAPAAGRSLGSCCPKRCCSALAGGAAGPGAGLRRHPAARRAPAGRAAATGRDRARPDRVALHAGAVDRGRAAVRRSSRCSKYAQPAPGNALKESGARIERRPRAASRAQQPGRGAGGAGAGAAGRLGADGPHLRGDAQRAAGLHAIRRTC